MNRCRQHLKVLIKLNIEKRNYPLANSGRSLIKLKASLKFSSTIVVDIWPTWCTFHLQQKKKPKKTYREKEFLYFSEKFLFLCFGMNADQA